MLEFVHQKNLERFRSLLERVTDERVREQLQQLIAEEEGLAEWDKQVAPKV